MKNKLLNKLFYNVIIALTCLVSETAYSKTHKINSLSDINAVVKSAEANDRIVFSSGTFHISQLKVTKTLSFESDGNTVIDGMGKGDIFIISADSVVLKNLTIKNTGISYTEDYAGVRFVNAKHGRVENCKLLACFFGITMQKSSFCSANNNIITGTFLSEAQTGNAIHLYSSKNISVNNNDCSGHRDGIYIEFTENSSCKNNKCHDNIRYGLHFMFSSNNSYSKNHFLRNGAGVAVMYSTGIIITDNYFSDNWTPVANGLLLKDIKNSLIERNEISGNTTAIYAEGLTGTIIRNNNFHNNGWAIKIMGNCEANSIEKNNFIANTFEVTTNSSVNHNDFLNNYWSNYSGYDLNKDGIGDVPHSPVQLFTYLTEQVPASIILMRSLFVDLLNLIEKITPAITPATLTDKQPVMKKIVW